MEAADGRKPLKLWARTFAPRKAFFTAKEKVTNTTEFNQKAAQTRAAVLVMGRRTWSQTLIDRSVEQLCRGSYLTTSQPRPFIT